jgi:hypothetical protein
MSHWRMLSATTTMHRTVTVPTITAPASPTTAAGGRRWAVILKESEVGQREQEHHPSLSNQPHTYTHIHTHTHTYTYKPKHNNNNNNINIKHQTSKRYGDDKIRYLAACVNHEYIDQECQRHLNGCVCTCMHACIFVCECWKQNNIPLQT